MARSVFISHTGELRDAPADRSFYDSAEDAVKSLGHAVIAQPYMAAEPTAAAEVCRREVAKADYVIVIVGFRYGSPVRDEPDVSYTELEFQEAKRLNTPCFVFLIDETTPDLTPGDVIDREYGDRQTAFRHELVAQDHVVGMVTTADALNGQVYKAINEWEDHHPDAEPPAPAVEPPPFDDIRLLLQGGDIIPFLGHDASLPPDYDPPDIASRPDNDALNHRIEGRVPSALELSMMLANYGQYPSGHRLGLPQVASYYSAVRGAPKLLQQRLRAPFVVSAQPRPIHRYLAAIDRGLLIFSVNFDDLMERALDEAERPYTTIIQPAAPDQEGRLVVIDSRHRAEPRLELPNAIDIDPDVDTVVYKPRGSVVREPEGWDQYIVTEDSNIGVLAGLASSSLPVHFYPALTDRQFLFLGVDLDSWPTRSLLSRIKADKGGPPKTGNRVNTRPAWAIRRNPSRLERDLWSAFSVDAFDLDLDRFTAGLG